MAIAAIEHIDVDARGIARVAGTRIKVIQLVMDKQTQGWSADELHRNFPHLTLGAIHAALAYYYDHQVELDSQIEEDRNASQRLGQQLPDPPALVKLREKDGKS